LLSYVSKIEPPKFKAKVKSEKAKVLPFAFALPPFYLLPFTFSLNLPRPRPAAPNFHGFGKALML
jgi:hypothetical protein